MAKVFGRECHKVAFDVYGDREYDLVLEFNDDRTVIKSFLLDEEVDPYNVIGLDINHCIRHIFCAEVYQFIFD